MIEASSLEYVYNESGVFVGKQKSFGREKDGASLTRRRVPFALNQDRGTLSRGCPNTTRSGFIVGLAFIKPVLQQRIKQSISISGAVGS